MHARLLAHMPSLPLTPDDPIATTPTHDELDQGHMSGAEEAPPTSNPTPAVVPSPDDSAKEVTEQEPEAPVGGAGGVAEDGGREEEEEELKFIDVEGDEGSSEGRSDRVESVTIDPSYNPNGEELLYEGDMEAEAPVPKPEKETTTSSQDEGFMISVHETGMELDMAESLSESHSKEDRKADSGSPRRLSSPHWRGGEGGGGAKRAKQSGKSSESKRVTLSPGKEVDRFVQSL